MADAEPCVRVLEDVELDQAEQTEQDESEQQRERRRHRRARRRGVGAHGADVGPQPLARLMIAHSSAFIFSLMREPLPMCR